LELNEGLLQDWRAYKAVREWCRGEVRRWRRLVDREAAIKEGQKHRVVLESGRTVEGSGGAVFFKSLGYVEAGFL
jgi:hypothetical protein